MPKVSIIVPIYNAEKYMGKCIKSIIEQNLKEIEIILINDGSTDNSAIMANEYSQNDERIRVIHQSNLGPSKARNVGIENATGVYLGFVDSDDYIEEDMYESLYKIANENSVQVAMCGYKEEYIYKGTSIKVESNLEANKVYLKQDINEKIIATFTDNINYGFYSLWNKIYLRDWIIKLGLEIDESREHGEDWWFNINVFTNLDSFICLNKPLYNYIHVNSNSLMAKYRENQIDLILESRKKMVSIIPIYLVKYRELNTRFIYELTSYILRTFREVKEKDSCERLINSVIRNQEVVEICKGDNNLPIRYRLIVFLIKNKFYKATFIFYRVANFFR